MNNKAVTCIKSCGFLYSSRTGIQEGTQCTKCKNEWALKTSIALLYVLCTLLTIAVAVLGYKGKTILLVGSSVKHSYVSDGHNYRATELQTFSKHLFTYTSFLKCCKELLTCAERR